MGISKRWESASECSGLPGEDHEGRNDNFWGLYPLFSRVEAPVKWLLQETSGMVSPDVPALVNWA